jgi:hypothetical protein
MDQETVNASRPARNWCSFRMKPQEALQQLDELGYLIDEAVSG